ncbi:AAA family ATPase [Streptacidiphilus anmyonensis]|uniref:AAA family ATPase n=1 Tax=Streptacidiphilus anmyonensis TaxID=405782 RepID=UPI0006944404|nr:AAA family ATPase [Streptacidiphilus anmyonensis]
MTVKLKTRKPTGLVPWPFLLIEGEEGAGKTYAAAKFSASRRIGPTYWVDLAEGSADEYAAIDGARFEIVDHDGTFRDIREQIEAVHAEARRAAAAKAPPVVLVLDTATALWRMLTTWTHERARRSRSNARTLAADPDAPIEVAMNLWNDANERWQQVLYLLQTFPGIVIVTARGREVTAIDEDGRPVKRGNKVMTAWKVQAQRDLGFDCSLWVRLRREEQPQVIKTRSLRLRVEPGKPLTLPKLDVEDLIFTRLGCSVDTQPRQVTALAADRTRPWLGRVSQTGDVEALKALWRETSPEKSGLTREEAAVVQAAIRLRKEELEAPPSELADPASDADKLRAAAQRAQAPADADAEGS